MPTQALSILPALLQASVLALLSASIPLSSTFNTASLAVLPSSEILILDPTPKQIIQATSIHVLAFDSHGALIMDESQGSFDLTLWDKVFDEAKRACCKPEDGDMDEDRKKLDMQTFVERVVEAKVEMERGWKNG